MVAKFKFLILRAQFVDLANFEPVIDAKDI